MNFVVVVPAAAAAATVVAAAVVVVVMKRYMSEKMLCVQWERTWGDMEVGSALNLSDLPSHVVNKMSMLVAKIG